MSKTTNYINYILVAYAFVVPTSRAGIVLTTALLLILWVIEGNLKDKFKKLLTTPITALLILFLLLNIVSLVWSEDVSYGLNYVRRYWYLSAVFVMATSLDKRYIPYMINAFLAGMFISEIISYGIFFEWWHYKNVQPEFPTPFMHHIQYSMFLAFTALLLLNKTFLEEKLLYKTGYILYFLFVTTNLFINGGRTGQLAFVIALFAVGVLNMQNKAKSIIFMALLSLSSLYLGYHFSPNFEDRIDKAKIDANLILEEKNYCDSFGRRVGSWIVAKEIIQDNPIVGVGVSDAMSQLRLYIDKNHKDKVCVKDMPSYHNDFIQIFVQLGFLGAIIFTLLLYSIATLFIKEKEYRNLTIIFIIIYTISSMFDHTLHQQFSMGLFALFVGIFVSVKRSEHEDNR